MCYFEKYHYFEKLVHNIKDKKCISKNIYYFFE